MDPAFATSLGRLLGASLAGVRVHAGPAAEDAARFVGARAFAVGEHIWLGAGARADDPRLLAHEAAHVIQQRGGPGHGLPAPSRAGGLEAEARRVGEIAADLLAARIRQVPEHAALAEPPGMHAPNEGSSDPQPAPPAYAGPRGAEAVSPHAPPTRPGAARSDASDAISSATAADGVVAGSAPVGVQMDDLAATSDVLSAQVRAMPEGAEIFVSGQSVGMVMGAEPGDVRAYAYRTASTTYSESAAIHIHVAHPEDATFHENSAVLIPWSGSVEIHLSTETYPRPPRTVEFGERTLIVERPEPVALEAPPEAELPAPPPPRAAPRRGPRAPAPGPPPPAPEPAPLSPAREELLRRIEEIEEDVGRTTYTPEALLELQEERDRLLAELEQPLGPRDLSDAELEAEIETRRDWFRRRRMISLEDERIAAELHEMHAEAASRRETRRRRRAPRIRRDVNRIMELAQQRDADRNLMLLGMRRTRRRLREQEQEILDIVERHAVDPEAFEEFLTALDSRHYWGGLFEQHYRPGIAAVLQELTGRRRERVRELLATRSTRPRFREYEPPEEVSFWGEFWEGVKSGEVRDQIFAYFQGLGDAGVAMAESIALLVTDPVAFAEGIARLPEAIRLFWENREELWRQFLAAEPTEQSRMIGRLVGEAELFLISRRIGGGQGTRRGPTATAPAVAAEVQITARGEAVLRMFGGQALNLERLGPAVQQGLQMSAHTAQLQGGVRNVAEAAERAEPPAARMRPQPQSREPGGPPPRRERPAPPGSEPSGPGRAPRQPEPGSTGRQQPRQRGAEAARSVDLTQLNAAQREAVQFARARPSLARLADSTVLWLHEQGLFNAANRRSFMRAGDRTIEAINRFAGEHNFDRVVADWLARGPRQEGARWVLHAGYDLFGDLPRGTVIFEGTLARGAAGRPLRITDVMAHTQGGMLWEFKNVIELRRAAVRQLLTDLVEVGYTRGLDRLRNIRWVFNSEKMRRAGITRQDMIARLQRDVGEFFRHLPADTVARIVEAIPDIIVFYP